ncbi:cytochrome P450 4d8 [Caerostris extrusa]|uniref:Cytochrome P450 4d8 n=1 Tax=Caerostris extrusa TaxID=172846 RepID=A0AAV4U6A5_CAEEX|nr:cytochrome P450 4d8 [Caerostris extrusa]
MGDDSRRPKCLLDVLLKLHMDDQVLDEEGVRQEVDTFIVGGHDTVAVAVKWALYLIDLYPEVQERIHQELDSVLGTDSKGPLSVADLNELKYLDCVLKECNQIYPPVPIIARKISEDISIRVWRDGSESPGVSHSEKLLPSLSGLEGPSASHHQNHAPIVSTRPHQVSTQTTENDFYNCPFKN